jgi:hypothetical protein
VTDASLPRIGVVEGFYGRAWGEGERLDFLEFAGRHALDFYLYAPKADAFLRRRWREPYPEADRARLVALAEGAARNGVEFGVGLSPYELYKNWDADARTDLRSRVRMIDAVGARTLGLLFDDMKGDQARLAELQAEIADFAAEVLPGKRIVLCPTYYSDDPVLDRMFGPRPSAYRETIGRKLAPEVEIVWTGPKICSEAYPAEHLAEVTGAFGRPLWLWDNYPVNDGPRMCPFLHLRAIRDRAGEIAPYLSAHAINPMNQAVLSRIPILTELEARECARQRSRYDAEAAWRRAALEVLGSEAFAARVEKDLALFQDRGWKNLGEEERRTMALAYSGFSPSPARDEILEWLAGKSQVTDAETFLAQ